MDKNNRKYMEISPSSQEYTLRSATADDAAAIHQIISLVDINITGLKWQRFLLAIDREDNIIGCGQVKPHIDGSHELSSIAVLPEWRGKGIARTIIEHLLELNPGKVYLWCRSELGPMYQKFGFQTVHIPEMSPYFQFLSMIYPLLKIIILLPEHFLVMCRK